jgi:CRP/FNR family cyclic AMP-dependent transcriptional regulator
MGRFDGGPSRRAAAGSGASLLELDPQLGCLLSPERRAAAMRELHVRVTGFPTGEWDGARLTEADPTHFGLLIVDGVLAREVVLLDTVSTELLGPGDIMRPWHAEGAPELLPVHVRWNALSDVRLGLIDRSIGAQLGAYPEIGAVIVDRLAERAQRLAIAQAISKLNRVDQRVLALFWHLAERWGRVSTNGISVPLALSHRLIGELVGARRPTVSTALATLARAGELVRRPDATWLLTGEPLRRAADASEAVRQRRRLMPPPDTEPLQPAGTPLQTLRGW